MAILLRDLRIGGAERAMIHLANGFAEAGHRTTLLTWGPVIQPSLAHEISPRVTHIQLPPSGWLRAIWRVAVFLHRERPRALISALLKANWVAALAGRLARCPHRVLVTEHSHLGLYLASKPPLTRRVIRSLLQLTHRLAGKVISVTATNSRLVEKISRLPHGSVLTIPNPIVISRASAALPPEASSWLAPDATPRLLAVGRLTPVKNFTFLIEAFHLLRQRQNTRLLILGDGEERDQLHDLIQRLHLGHDVILLPFQPDTSPFYARADTLLMTSLHESFGMVILEAFAHGTPVVACDCPTGPREITQNGQLAALTPPGDAEAFVRAVTATLKQGKPAELQQRLRDHAATYNLPSVVAAYEHILAV